MRATLKSKPWKVQRGPSALNYTACWYIDNKEKEPEESHNHVRSEMKKKLSEFTTVENVIGNSAHKGICGESLSPFKKSAWINLKRHFLTQKLHLNSPIDCKIEYVHAKFFQSKSSFKILIKFGIIFGENIPPFRWLEKFLRWAPLSLPPFY